MKLFGPQAAACTLAIAQKIILVRTSCLVYIPTTLQAAAKTFDAKAKELLKNFGRCTSGGHSKNKPIRKLLIYLSYCRDMIKTLKIPSIFMVLVALCRVQCTKNSCWKTWGHTVPRITWWNYKLNKLLS